MNRHCRPRGATGPGNGSPRYSSVCTASPVRQVVGRRVGLTVAGRRRSSRPGCARDAASPCTGGQDVERGDDVGAALEPEAGASITQSSVTIEAQRVLVAPVGALRVELGPAAQARARRAAADARVAHRARRAARTAPRPPRALGRRLAPIAEQSRLGRRRARSTGYCRARNRASRRAASGVPRRAPAAVATDGAEEAAEELLEAQVLVAHEVRRARVAALERAGDRLRQRPRGHEVDAAGGHERQAPELACPRRNA